MSPEAGVECLKTPSVSNSFSLLHACSSRWEASASASAAVCTAMLPCYARESQSSAQGFSGKEDRVPCVWHRRCRKESCDMGCVVTGLNCPLGILRITWKRGSVGDYLGQVGTYKQARERFS